MSSIISVSGKIGHGKDLVGKIIQCLTSNDSEDIIDLYNDPMMMLGLYDDTNKNYDGNYSTDYEIKKFADKLKDIVCILIGCTRKQLEDREFKEAELGEEWILYKITTYSDTKLFSNGDEAQNYLIENISNGGLLTRRFLTPRLLLQLIGTDCFRNIIHPNTWVNSLFAEYNTDSKWIITDTRFPNEDDKIKIKNGLRIRVVRPDVVLPDVVSHDSEIALDHVTDWDYLVINDGTILELIIKIYNILLKEGIVKFSFGGTISEASSI